jgi:hypothetical protein
MLIAIEYIWFRYWNWLSVSEHCWRQLDAIWLIGMRWLATELICWMMGVCCGICVRMGVCCGICVMMGVCCGICAIVGVCCGICVIMEIEVVWVQVSASHAHCLCDCLNIVGCTWMQLSAGASRTRMLIFTTRARWQERIVSAWVELFATVCIMIEYDGVSWSVNVYWLQLVSILELIGCEGVQCDWMCVAMQFIEGSRVREWIVLGVIKCVVSLSAFVCDWADGDACYCWMRLKVVECDCRLLSVIERGWL